MSRTVLAHNINYACIHQGAEQHRQTAKHKHRLGVHPGSIKGQPRYEVRWSDIDDHNSHYPIPTLSPVHNSHHWTPLSAAVVGRGGRTLEGRVNMHRHTMGAQRGGLGRGTTRASR